MKFVAEPEQVQLRYVGYFKEPVFHVLGNPAPLYRTLLRRFRPYGADVRSLSIDLSVLPEAYVACALSSGSAVRVRLDGLEVFIPSVRDQAQVEALIESGWDTMADTDDSLMTTTHEWTVIAWAKLKDHDFASYIGEFVKPPIQGWRPAVQFLHGQEPCRGSILLEESDRATGDLFMKSVIRVDGLNPVIADVMPKYRNQLMAQLESLGLNLQLRI